MGPGSFWSKSDINALNVGISGDKTFLRRIVNHVWSTVIIFLLIVLLKYNVCD